MNVKLAREIYGNTWFVDPLSFMQLSRVLEGMQKGVTESKNETKSNQFGIISNDLVFNAKRISRMDAVPKGSIAAYNFDSVITKYGGWSHYGTTEIASQFTEMESNDNVIGHLFFIESGGGSANAIKYIREVSQKSVRKKPLVVYAEDIMASAAMYIASDADYIYVKSEDAIIGSIGTMIQIEGFKSGTEDKNGKRHLRIYADKSFNKNKEFEDAINDFNYELIKKNILNPHAEEFIRDMELNRPGITEEQKTGAIFKAGQVVGSLIDGIGSLQDAIDKINELSISNKFSNNQNSSKMTIEELKAKHPEVYAQVFGLGKAEGISEENSRVKAWAVFNDVEPDKVKAGILSEEVISRAEELEFMRAAQKADLQASLENSSSEDITPDKSKGKVKPKISETDKAVEAAFDELEIEKAEE